MRFSLILVTSYLLLANPVYAADNPCQPRTPTNTAGVDIGVFFGFGNITSLGCGTSLLVSPMFDVAEFLVIFYFLLGAFNYLRAGGNKEEVEKGRQMITQAIVGFILLMLSFFVIQFLLSSLFGPETGGFVNIFKQ